jgi:hypothetical protein
VFVWAIALSKTVEISPISDSKLVTASSMEEWFDSTYSPSEL